MDILLDVLPLLLFLGIGAVCFKAAADKGRNRWAWGLMGTFLPLLGLVGVLLIRRIPREDAAEPNLVRPS